ncbi:MAG: C-terminal target protein [Bacteroidetes bacterium]|nr:C-terminal target protein [Bacteroidota bacterium]
MKNILSYCNLFYSDKHTITKKLLLLPLVSGKSLTGQKTTGFLAGFRSLYLSWFMAATCLLLISISAKGQVTISTSGFVNNNGSSAVSFNFVNNNAFPVIITDLASITTLNTSTTAELWYKPGAITGPPGQITVANGWTMGASGTFTGISNASTTVTQPMLTGISVTIPASSTYGLCFNLVGGQLRYATVAAGTYTFSGSGCDIVTGTNIGYGGTVTALTNTVRGFLGSLTIAAACSGTPTPGNTISSANPACGGTNFTLTTQNVQFGGSTFQWESSPDGTTWTPVSGATSATYIANTTTSTYYRVFVTCTNSGMSATSTPVLVNVSPVLSGSTVVTNTACFGGSNGAINLTPSGGTPGYTFNWGGGVTTEDRTALAAGTYTCFITDANACAATVTAIVTQPTPVSGTKVVTSVACFGGSNGAINFTPSGGTPGYTFNWGGGITTEDRTGLAVGNYTVITTDANSCTGSLIVTVTQPSAPVSGTTVVTNVSCFGGSNGAINLTPSGGTPGYTFNWGGGVTTEDRTGLAAGTYTVITTDANGCTGAVIVTVTQPSAPVSGTTVVTNVACFGVSNGAINLTPSGGTPGYTFNWLPSGPTTEDRTGLTAGTYSVQVTDANGCTGTVTVNVTQPSAPVSGTTVVTNVACFGGSNGAINFTPSGGTPGYTFNWGGGVITEDRTGLADGNYTVTTTDANGCTGTVAVTVTEPSAPVSGTTVETNVACFGGSNGTIDLTPTGGTPGYTYNWLPSGPTTQDRIGIAAGTYTVQITDANSCTGTVAVTVTQPSAPVSGTTIVTSVACFGGSNGAINFTPSGGTPGYTFNWGGGVTTEDRTGLASGNYTVITTDANGCTGTVTVTVTQPSAPVSGTTVVTNVACFGGSNGTIDLTPTGGTPGYTYNWLPSGPTTQDRIGISAGTYTVQITDANGCTGTVTVTVTQPPAISVSLASQTNISCNGGSNGAATVSVSGGTTSYSYNWTPGNPTGDGTASVTGLTAGTWTCTVTDANSCVATQTVNITSPTALVVSLVSQTNISCNGGSNGAATVLVSGGTSSYSYNWTPGNPTGDGTASVTGLTAGTWTCTVTDANSCVATQTVNITAPTALVATSSSTPVLCNGGSSVVTISASGGTTAYTGTGTFTVTAGPYTYTVTDANGCTAVTSVTVTEPTALMAMSSSTPILCNGGSSTITVSAMDGTAPYTGTGTFTVTAGAYSYTVTDANGCTAVTSGTVTEPTALMAMSSSTPILCNGGSSTITVSAMDGTGPYTGEGTFTVTAGAYSYTVTDANGCTAVTSGTVTEPIALMAMSSSTPILCNGGSSVITVSAMDGTGPYTGEGTFTATAGAYSYTVTDANGCTAVTSGTVTEPSPITSAVTTTNSNCGSSNGSAIVSAAGGTGTLTYSWSSGGSTATEAGLVSGTYTVTITDGNSCVVTDVAVVSDLGAPAVTDMVTNLTCNGSGDGAIDITPTGGAGSYTYNWSNSASTEDLSGLAAGVYTYTVTDGASCQAVGSVTVTEPSAIDVSTTTNTSNITANESAATAYQWIDCDNANTPIAGETNQSYTFTADGNYAVIVTMGACSDTSACVNINTNGIKPDVKNTELVVYPNPNNGVFTISSTSEGVYSIVNELGQTLQTLKLNTGNNFTLNVRDLSNGVYFISGISNNKITKQKIIVTQ